MREEEMLQQVFIAITARWHRESGPLAIGVTRSRLKTAGAMSEEELDSVLAKLRGRLDGLGLDLVEYLYEGEVWYAVRSGFACPSELSGDDEAALAVLMSAVEPDETNKVSLEALKKRLVTAKYCTDYQLDRILKNLEHLGYIQRKSKMIGYGPRTMLEFSKDARKHIAEECGRFVF